MANKILRKIGYWHEKGSNDNLPRATDFVDKEFNEETKKLVLLYIKERCKINNSFKGFSLCRICNISNGSIDLTDGEYVFPSGYSHYIENHNVVPPIRFIKKVLKYFKEKNKWQIKN